MRNLVGLVCLVGIPNLAHALCSYTVAPTCNIALDGATSMITGKLIPVEHWTCGCVPMGGCPNWMNNAKVTVVYAATMEKVLDGSNDEIGQMQTGQTQLDHPSELDFVGAKLTAMFTGQCGDPSSHSTPVTVTGNTIVVPPWVAALPLLSANASPAHVLDGSGYIGPADKIPVGKKFKAFGLMAIHPKGAETATFKMTGPGINFSKAYGAGTDATHGTETLYFADDAADVVASGPGDVKFWIEFEGTMSDVRTLTVIAAGTNPDMGTRGGGAGGGGCSLGGSRGAMAIPWLLVGIVVLPRLRRRRTS